MIIAFSLREEEQNPAYDLLPAPRTPIFNLGKRRMSTYAIVPAAGQGLRMGLDRPKQFLDLLGKPILVHTLERVLEHPRVDGVVLVLPEQFIDKADEILERLIGSATPWRCVAGGQERQDSVLNGLAAVPGQCEWVTIHDGVRPFASSDLFERTWLEAQRTGAAICALAATDTVKRVRGGEVVETIDREEIWLVQTPQVFRKDLLHRAYRRAQSEEWQVTDDASLVERAGIPVRVVPGERANIKVTTVEDLEWAKGYLANH